jgi:hypothetical protein
MRFRVALVLSVLIAHCECSGDVRTHTPRFEDYPVVDIFGGPPVEPKSLVAPSTVEKVTNFAGHYMVIQWTGAPNPLVLDIVDAKTGHVLTPPLFPNRFLWGTCANCILVDPQNFKSTEFRLNSRLMIFERACPFDRPLKPSSSSLANCGR